MPSKDLIVLAIFFIGGILVGEIIHNIFDNHDQIKRFWPTYLIILSVLLICAILISVFAY